MKTVRGFQIVVRSVLSARTRPAFCKGSATVEVVDKRGIAAEKPALTAGATGAMRKAGLGKAD
jgi:hypothetical protein